MRTVNRLAHSVFEPHVNQFVAPPQERSQWSWWAAQQCFEKTGQSRLWRALVNQSPVTTETIAKHIERVAESAMSTVPHSLEMLTAVAESVEYLARLKISVRDIPDFATCH